MHSEVSQEPYMESSCLKPTLPIGTGRGHNLHQPPWRYLGNWEKLG